MKKCRRCDLFLSFDNFHLCKRSKDGYKNECKICRKLDNNKNTIRIREKRKYNKNYLEVNKKYKENNLDFVKELKVEWSKSEIGKESKKKYYKNNTEIIKIKSSKYREKNIDLIREKEANKRKTGEYKRYRNLYTKSHRLIYPHIYAWRSTLRNTLKRLKSKKSASTIEILGYSPDDLKNHIESLFKDGMTWDNYGEWHIDHIKPVSIFDYNEDISVVNSLLNLQPLWAFENFSKSNKY